jgi:hypothetical protein
MRISHVLSTGAVAFAALTIFLVAPSQAQQKRKECQMITFRPIAAGMNDGQQDAGLYRSRFVGLVEVKGTVKGGQPQGYFVTVNNKPLTDAPNLPPGVASCAQAKKMPAPGKAVEGCNGDKLQLLIDKENDKRYFVLYARQGSQWQVCNSGTA